MHGRDKSTVLPESYTRGAGAIDVEQSQLHLFKICSECCCFSSFFFARHIFVGHLFINMHPPITMSEQFLCMCQMFSCFLVCFLAMCVWFSVQYVNLCECWAWGDGGEGGGEVVSKCAFCGILWFCRCLYTWQMNSWPRTAPLMRQLLLGFKHGLNRGVLTHWKSVHSSSAALALYCECWQASAHAVYFSYRRKFLPRWIQETPCHAARGSVARQRLSWSGIAGPAAGDCSLSGVRWLAAAVWLHSVHRCCWLLPHLCLHRLPQIVLCSSSCLPQSIQSFLMS